MKITILTVMSHRELLTGTGERLLPVIAGEMPVSKVIMTKVIVKLIGNIN